MKFKSFAELIKYYREYVLFMTQEEFAEKYAGFSKETLKKWESGAIKKPSKTLVKVAFKTNEEYLRMAIDLLTDFEKEVEAPIEVEAEFEDKSEVGVKETETTLEASPESLIQKGKFLIDAFMPKNKEIKKVQTQWVDPVHTNFNLLNNGLEKEIAGKVIGKDLIISATGNDLINGNIYLQAPAGSGRMTHFIRPNLEHNYNKNYLIVGTELSKRYLSKVLPGFDIKVLNFSNIITGLKYNPFAYVQDENDVIMLMDNFLNTAGANSAASDPFFSIAERQFYYALGYITAFYLPEDERNFVGMYDLFKKLTTHNEALVDTNSTDKVTSAIEKMKEYFKNIEQNNPSSPAITSFDTFLNASPKTKQNIILSADIKLWFMSVANIRDFLSEDEVFLQDLVSNKKTCVCINTGDNDTYRFLVQTLVGQVLALAHKTGIHVRDHQRHLEIMINDIEKYNFQDIARFAAVNRLFNYSFDFIGHMSYYGNQSEAKTILANCDTKIYYGINSFQEANYISTLSDITDNGIVDAEQLHLVKEDTELLHIKTLGCSFINKANPRIDI